MGCWNGTCGLTQLPIREGERIALYPLVIKQLNFENRSSLTGHGATDNDLVAQPLSMPIFGEYDDYGGVKAEKQLGVDMLKQTLQQYADDDVLFVSRPARKKIKKVTEQVLETFYEGGLYLEVPNTTKQWIANLQKTVNETPEGERGGFSHYDRYLKQDLTKLPDSLTYGFGVMMVCEPLFKDVVQAQGALESDGWFDHRAKKLVKYGDTERAELVNRATLSEDSLKKVETARADFAKLDTPDEGDSILSASKMVESMVLYSRALHESNTALYATDLPDQLLSQAMLAQDAKYIDLWADNVLFCRAMQSLRKQWVPQTGAGSQAGLYEYGTLYRAVSKFMATALAEAEAEADE